MNKQRAFYPELESLRGLAALAVSLCHVFNSAQREHTAFVDFSFNDWAHYTLTSLFSSEGGVAIFFVLSGFVLSLQLPDEVTPRPYMAYMIRRLFRIMPAAWASVVFAYILLRTVHHQHPGHAAVYHGLFLYPADSIPINPPLWSLSVEMAISACLPLMVAANARLSPLFRLALLSGFVWLASIEGQPLFVQYLFAFQLGIMVPQGAALIVKLEQRLAATLFVVALVAVMSATNLKWQGLITERPQVLLEVFGAFYVVAFVHARRSAGLTMFLEMPPVRFLGRISYSLYLLNYPLIGWLFTILPGVHRDFDLWLMCRAAIVIIPINIFAAYISYRIFEVPFVRWGKRLAERSTWPATHQSAVSACQAARLHAQAVE